MGEAAPVNRREFLQAAAAAGLVLAVDIAPSPASELPSPTSIPSSNGGIDFNGSLGGIYITPTDRQTDAFAEVWITCPDGSVLTHHLFSQRGGWYWLAALGEHIVGPVNVRCSVDADILLAGKP